MGFSYCFQWVTHQSYWFGSPSSPLLVPRPSCSRPLPSLARLLQHPLTILPPPQAKQPQPVSRGFLNTHSAELSWPGSPLQPQHACHFLWANSADPPPREAIHALPLGTCCCWVLTSRSDPKLHEGLCLQTNKQIQKKLLTRVIFQGDVIPLLENLGLCPNAM